MLRRGLIRVPFLLALAFVVAVWVTSNFAGMFYGKKSGSTGWAIGAGQGLSYVVRYDGHIYRDHPLEFAFLSPPGMGVEYKWPFPRTLGFYVSPLNDLDNRLLFIFPLWLPTLLLAGLNWFVWRKTRRRKPGRGFPVEPSAAPKA